MTYRTRSLLFYALLVIFLIGGTGVVLYSQGWRVDIHTGAFEKVGALYVRTFPTDALLTLDGEPIENASWLLREGTLIDSLFPKTYVLEVSAPGYLPWRQTLLVEPSQVTERKYVVLVPEQDTPLANTSSTEAFWLLPDTTLVRKTTKDVLVASQGQLPGVEVVAWSDNARYVLTRNALKDYALLDTRRAASSTLPRSVSGRLNLRTGTPAFYISNEGEVVTYTSSTLALVNPATQTGRILTTYATPLSLSKITFRSHTNTLAWTVEDVKTYESRLVVAAAATPLNTMPLALPAPVLQIAWIDDTHLALLDIRGTLLLYETDRNQLTEIARDKLDLFAWSPANDAVAVRGEGYIEIVPRVPERDGVRIPLEDAERIVRLAWHRDTYHLFAIYPDRVDFIEAEPGGEQTVRTALQATSAAYDPESDTLYGLREGGIHTVSFPH